MNILKKIQGVFGVKSSTPFSITDHNAGGLIRSGGVGDSGEVVSEAMALGLSVVWACVNLISGSISTLPLVVYREDANGDLDVATSHPLYSLLKRGPNLEQTRVDFLEYLSNSIELWGNSYHRKVRLAGKIVGLIPINPAFMTVKRAANGSIVYSWVEDGRRFEFGEDDILHIRGSGGSPLGGISTLQVARNALSSARSADRAAGGVFKNGMRPSGVLTFENFLTEEQRTIAESKLQDKFSNAMNNGRPLILEGGTKWDSLSINPDDAQLLETRTFSVEELCRFFAVPPHMVGHTSKTTSWGSGIQEQNMGFLIYTLRRRLTRIEQAMEKQLFTPLDVAQGYSIKFNFEGLLRADSAGRASYYTSMSGIGAMTVNEIRRKENMKPIEGGDVARVQSQNIPLTETGNAQTIE